MRGIFVTPDFAQSIALDLACADSACAMVTKRIQ